MILRSTETPPYEKTTRVKYCSTYQRFEKKYRGDTKIRHILAEIFSGIFSASGKISKAMTTRKPSKPQTLVTRGRSTPTKKTSATSTSTPSTSLANAPKKPEYIMVSKVLFVRSADLNQFLLKRTTDNKPRISNYHSAAELSTPNG